MSKFIHMLHEVDIKSLVQVKIVLSEEKNYKVQNVDVKIYKTWKY